MKVQVQTGLGPRASGIALREVLEGDERSLQETTAQVRVGLFGEAGVSFGVADHPDARVLRRIEELGWRWQRRSTGGTALLHLPGDIFWSVVLPRTHPLASRGFVHRYAELGAGWVNFLSSRSRRSEWGPAPGTSERYCLLSSRGQVLYVEGKVLGGASQHATAHALLHHGFTAGSLRPEMLRELFELGAREVGQLTSLEDLGVRLREKDLNALARELAHRLDNPHPPPPA